MRKLLQIFILILLILIKTNLYSAKDNMSTLYRNFSEWMETAYTGDYHACRKIIDYLYTLATNKKIWGNDKQTMDVITYLGKMGTEVKVQNPPESYDYSSIRIKSVLALEAIGGDYAILCVLRIINAERHAKNPLVYRACLNALKNLGNDKEYITIKACRHIFEILEENISAQSIEAMYSFVECVEKLCTSAPYSVVKQHRIIEALKTLANEFPYYRIYPQELRKKAKNAVMYIMANANNK